MAERRSGVQTLYRHDWQDPAEWVDSLDTLARLTDAEISCLFQADFPHSAGNRNQKAT